MDFSFPFHPRHPLEGVPTAEDITKHFPDVLSDDIFLQTNGAEEVVKWLQNSDPNLIGDALDFMVTRGVVKKFAELFRSSNPNLEGLAAVVFGFLASGDTRHATIAFNSGIIPACIERLHADQPDVRTKSAWILGNLAADDEECAETLLAKGVLNTMTEQLTTMTNHNELSTYAPYATMLQWAINHFLKATPEIPSSLVTTIKELLCTIIMMDQEDVMLEECCFGLSTIVQIDDEGGSSFSNPKLCNRTVRLLQRGSNVSLQKATLQLVGALTARSEEYTNHLLSSNLLEALSELIEHPLGEDACWVLSNIVAESVEHLNLVVYHPKIIPTVIRLLKVDAAGFDEDEYAGRTRECCAILANVVNKGQVDPIRHTVSLGGISALCTALKFYSDTDTLVILLDALWKLILFGERDQIEVNGQFVNVYLKLFETNGGFEGLERLEGRREQNVAQAAQQMSALIEEIMNPVMDQDADQAATNADVNANAETAAPPESYFAETTGTDPNATTNTNTNTTTTTFPTNFNINTSFNFSSNTDSGTSNTDDGATTTALTNGILLAPAPGTEEGPSTYGVVT